MKPKIRLIDNWRSWHRFWSVRLTVAGSAFLSAFFLYPEAMLHIWNLIPPDMKAYIPARFAPFIPVSVIIAGVIARVVKQEGLHKNGEPRSSAGRSKD